MTDNNDFENCDAIVFADDEGNELEFYEVAYFEHKGKQYSALVSANEIEDDKEQDVVFCEVYEDEEGFEVFEPVEDDALADELFLVFDALEELECGCGCGCDEHDDDE